MNKRTVSIIQELSQPEKCVNIANLAEKFKVSERTVRNDLNTINDILKKNNLDIVRLEKGRQIIREDTFPNILDFIDEKDFYAYKLSKEERKKIASVLLISSPGFITLSDIADYMAVSRATVINDLEEIKSYIKRGNLEVHSHPNKGLRIEGTESDKRIFLVRLFNCNPEMADEDVVRKQIAAQEDTREVLNKILQEQVTTALSNSLKQGKIGHAYLFIGPRGTGKTSVARIFAHAVNDFAYSVEDSYLDIVEIDAASNTGVDNIRELREKAVIAPTNGKYKVYIIDEIHMLTKSASNALLKTLNATV